MRSLLLIDDDMMVLSALDALLSPAFHTRFASNGQDGLAQALSEPHPDLILLDVELPDLGGYEVCARLKQSPATAGIPIIFLSAHDDVASITAGFAAGGVDFVGKPLVPPILIARIETQLRLRDAREALAGQNRRLEEQVAQRTLALTRRTEELQVNQELMIVSLGCIAETRDNETGNHIQRTRAYVEILARGMSAGWLRQGGFAPEEIDVLWKAAPLHDIGKVGIPDHILLKPDKLTEAEFAVMKQHTTLGYNAIRSAETRVQATTPILQTAAMVALHHHERWNGGGYPGKLAGQDIPAPARLMAVADAYDAITNERVYHQARTHEEAVAIVGEERGRHFDPAVVDCFLEHIDEVRSVALRFIDSDVSEQLLLRPATDIVSG